MTEKVLHGIESAELALVKAFSPLAKAETHVILGDLSKWELLFIPNDNIMCLLND